jgi:hypothetical protein
VAALHVQEWWNVARESHWSIKHNQTTPEPRPFTRRADGLQALSSSVPQPSHLPNFWTELNRRIQLHVHGLPHAPFLICLWLIFCDSFFCDSNHLQFFVHGFPKIS